MRRERHLIAKDAISFVEREVWQPETPQERGKALALTLGAKPKGWGIRDEIGEIRELIDVALHGMGWPRSNECIAVDQNGEWRPITSPDELREGEKFHWSFMWISDAAEPLSEAYFLGKMSFEIAGIEHAIEAGDMLAIFRHGGRIGAHQTEIDVRRIALRYATIGRKQLAASEAGRATRSADSFKTLYGDEAQRRADALHLENQRRTWARIRQILAAEYEVSAETIKKALKNPKKNG